MKRMIVSTSLAMLAAALTSLGCGDASPSDAATSTLAPPPALDAGPEASTQPDAGDAGTDGPMGTNPLDPTFANGGIAANGFVPASVAVDAQGTVYIAGQTTNCVSATSGKDVTVRHFLENGQEDSAFGRVCLDFNSGTDDLVHQIALDPAGHVVIAGATATGHYSSAVVARLSPLGARDYSFGDNGVKVFDKYSNFVEEARAVAFHPDGSLLVSEGNAVWRLHDDGSFIAPIWYANAADKITSIRVTSDGVFLAVGIRLEKLKLDGSHDTAFGSSGVAQVTPGMTIAMDVGAQSDGKVLLAGPQGTTGPSVIDRYAASGLLDTAYAASGTATEAFVAWTAGTVENPIQRSGIAVQSDDKLVVAGFGDCRLHGGGYFGNIAVERITVNGSLDTSFAFAGYWCSGVTGVAQHTIGVATDAGRKKLVVVGADDANTQLYLYRLVL